MAAVIGKDGYLISPLQDRMTVSNPQPAPPSHGNNQARLRKFDLAQSSTGYRRMSGDIDMDKAGIIL